MLVRSPPSVPARLAVPALLAVLSRSSLGGCGSRPAAPAGPGVIELPSFHSCGPLRSGPGPDVVVAVRVIRPGPGNALITAGVCVDGQGPFTFVVDTGAEATGIDARLASRVHLSTSGSSPIDSFGCSRSISFARLESTIPAHTTVASASIRGGLLPVTEMTTQVSVAGRPANFVVDTGAVRTFVSPALAARAGLPAAGASFAGYTGYDCPVRTSQVALRTWRAGPAALAPTTAYSNVLPAGVDGLLGSGTLAGYSPVVVDYRDSALLLGPAPGSR